MLKVDVLQVFISASAIFGIGLFWINFNEKVFKTVRRLAAAPVRRSLSVVQNQTLRATAVMKKRVTGVMTAHATKRAHKCPNTHRFTSIENFCIFYIMSDNKLVKTIMDAATLTGFAAGIGSISKKVVKENLTADPSANVMNYAKFTAVMVGSIALKQYLEDQKILPN